MAVSFTPDWQSTTTTGSTLTIGAPSGGSVHVALVAVGDGATIVDTGGMVEQSVTRINPYGGFDVRVYTLTRPATSAPVELGLSAAATACGIVGAFPPGAYELLPPHTWTPVPGQPGDDGWVYQNPQEIDNATALPAIQFWLPAPTTLAGFFVSARDVGDPDPFSLSSDDGSLDKSTDLLVTDSSGVRIRLAGWAFEPDGPDPALFFANLAWSSEYRWVGVLGGEAPPPPTSGFRVGRIGFASLPPCTWDAAGAKLPGGWARADTTGATHWTPGEDEGTHPIYLYDESEGPIGAINGFTPGVTYHVEITVESGTPSNVALRSIHNTAPVTLTEGPGPIIRGQFTWDPTWSDWRNSARIVTTGEASGTVRFWVCGPPWPTPPE